MPGSYVLATVGPGRAGPASAGHPSRGRRPLRTGTCPQGCSDTARSSQFHQDREGDTMSTAGMEGTAVIAAISSAISSQTALSLIWASTMASSR